MSGFKRKFGKTEEGGLYMPKQVVSVENGGVMVRTVTDRVFANMAEPEGSEKDFNAMIQDLQKMVEDLAYRTKNASEFLRKHGVWLLNLAKTGFAIDYAQFVGKLR
jgi:hypothetical protein